MEIAQLIARESIRDLVARYNANGDSGRIEAMRSLFSDDAVLEVPGKSPLNGRDTILDYFSSVASGDSSAPALKSLHHHTATLQIDVIDEDHAKGRCYFSVYTQKGLDHWGRYIDEYCRSNQRWLIQRRRVFVDGVIPGGWAEARDRM